MNNYQQITSEDYLTVAENFLELEETEQKQVKTAFRNYIDTVETGDVVGMWDELVSEEKCGAYIYENDSWFFELCFTDRLDDMAQAISYGDYRYQDPYVWFEDCDGTLRSAEFEQNLPIDFEELTLGMLSDPVVFADVLNDFAVWCEDNEINFAEVTEELKTRKTDSDLTLETLANINKVCGTNLNFDGEHIFEDKGDNCIYSTPLFPSLRCYTPREALEAARSVAQVVFAIKNEDVTITK